MGVDWGAGLSGDTGVDFEISLSQEENRDRSAISQRWNVYFWKPFLSYHGNASVFMLVVGKGQTSNITKGRDLKAQLVTHQSCTYCGLPYSVGDLIPSSTFWSSVLVWCAIMSHSIITWCTCGSCMAGMYSQGRQRPPPILSAQPPLWLCRLWGFQDCAGTGSFVTSHGVSMHCGSPHVSCVAGALKLQDVSRKCKVYCAIFHTYTIIHTYCNWCIQKQLLHLLSNLLS